MHSRCLRVTLLAITLLATAACSDPQDQPEAKPAPNTGTKKTLDLSGKSKRGPGRLPRGPDGPVDTHAEALDLTRANLKLYSEQEISQPTSWLAVDHLARAYMMRSRLNGTLHDLKMAEKAIDRSFRRAPEGVGPWLTKANLMITLHRFDEAEKAIAGHLALPGNRRRADPGVSTVQGQLALSRGQYDDAANLFKQAYEASFKNQTGPLVLLAHVHDQVGEPNKTVEILERTLKAPIGQEGFQLAWLNLQRGIFELDRGRCDLALPWFDKADKALSGWYLIEEHKAECLATTGKLDEALALYREVIAKNDSPEFQAALAGVLEEKGDQAGAKAAEAKAREGFAKLLKKHPQAMYGHALDFFLESSEPADLTMAEELATKNHELRPGGEAKVKLAMALLRTGKLDEAAALLEKAGAMGHRSADYWMAQAKVHEAQGDKAKADAAIEEAKKLHTEAPAGWDWLKKPA